MTTVLLLREMQRASIESLLARYSLALRVVATGVDIPGSYWGNTEAGLIGAELFVRTDTPLHSVLHEAAHFVCMTGARRAALLRDAGGDDLEENAVCYLQIVWAEQMPSVGRHRLCVDMNAWGYSFRLGCAKRWFEEDASDARQWLLDAEIIDGAATPTYRLRA